MTTTTTTEEEEEEEEEEEGEKDTNDKEEDEDTDEEEEGTPADDGDHAGEDEARRAQNQTREGTSLHRRASQKRSVVVVENENYDTLVEVAHDRNDDRGLGTVSVTAAVKVTVVALRSARTGSRQS